MTYILLHENCIEGYFHLHSSLAYLLSLSKLYLERPCRRVAEDFNLDAT